MLVCSQLHFWSSITFAITYLVVDHDRDQFTITYLVVDHNLEHDCLADRKSRGETRTLLDGRSPIVITYLITEHDLCLDRDHLADCRSQLVSSSMVQALVKIVSLITIALLIAVVIVSLTIIKVL